MRMMVKKLLKRYKYPPEGTDDAVQTVLAQCELWTDNVDMEQRARKVVPFEASQEESLSLAAEKPVSFK